jgi:hypothetical protein
MFSVQEFKSQQGVVHKGLFASRWVDAGTVVLEVQEHEATVWERAQAWWTSDPTMHFDLREPRDVSGAVVQVVIEAPAKYLNHACVPNCLLRTTSTGSRQLQTITDVQKGEELRYDYAMHWGIEYATDTVSFDADQDWLCECKAAQCRRSVILRESFWDLPIVTQQRYLPLLDSWFTEKYSTRLSQLVQHE